MVAVPFLNPGDLVGGKYAITGVIGSGGMAIVYEALHVRLDQRVALKMLLPEMLELDDIVMRFEREARAAVRLRSPHVARVFDVDALPDGTPYMVMELLDGRDLAAELTIRGPLPLADAIDYVLQACDAMAEAHRQGTVHRDLKPSNLFLTREGQRDFVKVLDFGVSKIALESVELSVTSTRSALGTALYMSPEQVRSAKSVDARTDVWSLGVVLYELLTARLPFEGESTTAVAAAIVADEPVPLGALRQDLPSGLEEVVMKALAKDREKRFSDAATFAAALAPFQAFEAAAVSLVSLAGRAGAPPERTAEAAENDMPPERHGPSRAPTEVSAETPGKRLRLVGSTAGQQALPETSHAEPPAETSVSSTSAPVDVTFDQHPAGAHRPIPSYMGFQAGVPVFTSPAARPQARAGAPKRTAQRVVMGACGAVAIGLIAAAAPKLAHRMLAGDSSAAEGSTAATSPAVLVGVLPIEALSKNAPDAGTAAETPSATASAPLSAPAAIAPQRAAPPKMRIEKTPSPLRPATPFKAMPPRDTKSPPAKPNVDLPDDPG